MSQREKVNILLVDDQPQRLISYEAILSSLGENLVRAGSGVEALDKLMKDEFAVILLDVSMPGMDGFETAQLIHEHPRFEKTPVIFVTALHVTDLDRMKGYELGAVDYVYVPVIPEILRSKVAVLVELHLKRRELQRVNHSLAQANAELALANSTLQAEKTRELERLNATLEAANADLARANATLKAEVAERARLDAVLREGDRRKDEFLAMLAHELRNPLAPILNSVQILRRKPIDDPEMLWCRDVVERQVQHLTRIVEDLLDVSRITQGKIKLQRAPIDVENVVSRAIETCRPLLDARRHELSVELPAQAVRIDGDLTRLAQVVGNLLNNAAKYTHEGGKIRLAVEAVCEREGACGEAVIRVTDNGTGIPPEMLPSVFDLFTQAERTLDRAQGGLGIGLALVQRLVALHGGTVHAASEGAGKGSEFTIRLPLLDVAPAAPSSPSASSSIAREEARGPRRVLVVDDNVDSVRGLAILLEGVGNVVETAFDGAEAIEVAERFRPDVVLLDIGMPRLNGYAAARRIREFPWARDVLLIAITGWGQDDVRARVIEAGFDAHIVKPVEFDALTRVLAKKPGAVRSLVDSR